MNTDNRPLRTTILFGMLCGLLFIPARMIFGTTFFWPILFPLLLFSALCAYAFLLAGWGGRPRRSVLFPLFLLLLFLFTPGSNAAFILLALGLLSWIRSGICFRNGYIRSLGVELALCIGGAALVAYFNPHSAFAWGLGIWLFFLIQSLYFTFLAAEEDGAEWPVIDPFDQARMRAESILKI